ncbi:hypothetical protein [Thermomonospora umbrina]|uniref:Uncharacterized protein n=1 Tax=Thermomonospora umbrina TaxID=111806 RepID=A0A3D9SG87_9ACTN|nr:hypothetical protein [Thermomonospora umbrina]REE94697.1 hypothetical protein DFJ69_0045 [Thermomonospora umbrina]
MNAGKPSVRDPADRLRILGYGGSVLLVLAAVAVLLMPLFDDGDGTGAATAGARTVGGAGTTASPGAGPTGDDQRRSQGRGEGPGGESGPGGSQHPGGGGQGDPVPLPGGRGTADHCPDGLGAAEYGVEGLSVVVRMDGEAFVHVKVHLQGLSSVERTGRVKGGRPHTFVFRDAPVDLVERIQLSYVGSTVPQTCDLRLG